MIFRYNEYVINNKIIKLTNNVSNLTNITNLLQIEETKQTKILKKYYTLEEYKNIISSFHNFYTFASNTWI